MNPFIDVIIPAYKAHSTIVKTICSIVEQSISEAVNVIIVNDACPEGSYKSIVDMFTPVISIKEVILESNGGPGAARQAGVNAGEAPFIVFIDADDTFSGAYSLDILLSTITKNPTLMCISSVFIEVHDKFEFLRHENDMTWVFGKIYRRSFLEKYKIRFNNTRANEDSGFNTKVKLLCMNSDAESIYFIDEPTYFWHDKEDSITRINNCQYSFDQSPCGWVDNMIEAINFTKSIQPFNGHISAYAVECMFNLYTMYIQCLSNAPVFGAQLWEYIKKYYNTCYAPLENSVSPDIKAEVYSRQMHLSYTSGRMNNVIPALSIDDFLGKLKNEAYNPEDIYNVYESMPKDLIENNIRCGVCKDDYYVNNH